MDDGGLGIIHDEFHSQAFTRDGGTLEMVQLWVNLPAKHKMALPGYQTLLDRDIPSVDLPGGAGRGRVVAGELEGRRGPARTFTPIDVWDIRLRQGGAATFGVADGRNTVLVVLEGTVLANEAEVARQAQIVLFDRSGSAISVEANTDAKLLLLAGEPIGEPVAGYGPFVMNTRDEIRQAVLDFNEGRFGRMAP